MDFQPGKLDILMSKQKKESFFWTSFSDLMISLFFVMLVLFVLTIALLHRKMVEIEKERIATQSQLDKIREIEESIKNINPDYFAFDPQFKRHTLKDINISFDSGSANFNDINDVDKLKLLNVGISIKNFVDEAIKKNPSVKYLVIIEGQSSKDNYHIDEFRNNDVLSFRRALALKNFWASKNGLVNFDSKVCELIVSGSGQNSPYRIQPDNWKQKANQRFVIHIIPKPGIFETSKIVVK